jgi:cobalt-zinc-cadmium efflux system membrane fusion protein
MKRREIALGFLMVLVVAALSGLALATARPSWLPAWARIAPQSPAAEDAGLYCKEHGVPEKFCTLCHEELAKTLLLCKEHGDIPEDICTLCHPEAEAKYNIEMCKNHGLPKHFCAECGKGPSALRVQPDDGWCAVHDKPESLCDACLQAKAEGAPFPSEKTGAAKGCRMPLPTVRLASAGLARKIGIETAAATEEEHAHTLLANAETAYDANHYADVNPRVAGFIRDVKVDLGRVVRQGDVLAVVDSAEVSAAKTLYLTSKATVKLAEVTAERTKLLSKSGALPGKLELEMMTSLNQSQAAAMDAEQKLKNLGFDDDALAEILDSKDTRSLISIVAPIDGTVVVRHAVKGEAVQPTSQLFAIADTSRMWLWIDVYESDIAKVSPGQSVRFTVSGADPADAAFPDGKVTWIGSEVNPQSRTARIRAELANPEARLRANQFGQATIDVGDPHKAVVVPKEAVQRKESVDVVFLPEGDGVYRPQRVTTRSLGRDDRVEVTWGLKPGQLVVSRGAFLLKTEIMKGAIGAGCCE